MDITQVVSHILKCVQIRIELIGDHDVSERLCYLFDEVGCRMLEQPGTHLEDHLNDVIEEYTDGMSVAEVQSFYHDLMDDVKEIMILS